MFRKRSETRTRQAGEGVSRRVLIYGGSLMAVEFTFAPGTEVKLHSHPHEQIGHVLKGRFEMTIGAEIFRMEAGDSYYAPPDTLHGVRTLEEGLILDVFCPPREDYLD